MLEKRPYEPKEIKPVTITTHDTYTSFDCRKVPYPDRHYADPEAGCSVSVWIFVPKLEFSRYFTDITKESEKITWIFAPFNKHDEKIGEKL